MDLMVEASPRRVFSNAHTYHINSISVNSDCETYLSADDLRVNLWNLEISDRSFSILSCVVGPLVYKIYFGLLLIFWNKSLFFVVVENAAEVLCYVTGGTDESCSSLDF